MPGDYFYILDDDHNPVAIEDIHEWGRWRQDREKSIVAQTIVGDKRISTVFLGVDHGFGFLKGARPILFETMIFPEPEDPSECGQERYCTWAEAEEGHRRWVEHWTPPPPPPEPYKSSGKKPKRRLKFRSK